MKLLMILLTFGLALSSPAFAAKGEKKGAKGARGEMRAAIKAADKNGNHTIDADEVASLNEALGKAGTESGLKRIDRNGDGKLGDDEVKALNERMAKRAEGGKKKKSK